MNSVKYVVAKLKQGYFIKGICIKGKVFSSQKMDVEIIDDMIQITNIYDDEIYASLDNVDWISIAKIKNNIFYI